MASRSCAAVCSARSVLLTAPKDTKAHTPRLCSRANLHPRRTCLAYVSFRPSLDSMPAYASKSVRRRYCNSFLRCDSIPRSPLCGRCTRQHTCTRALFHVAQKCEPLPQHALWHVSLSMSLMHDSIKGFLLTSVKKSPCGAPSCAPPCAGSSPSGWPLHCHAQTAQAEQGPSTIPDQPACQAMQLTLHLRAPSVAGEALECMHGLPDRVTPPLKAAHHRRAQELRS